MYADDTKIWREISDWNDHLALQNDINSLFHWACVTKMSFHPQKCKVLSVAKNKYEPLLTFQIFFYDSRGTLLDYADSEKDLGVIINSTLSTDKQCDKIYSKMN